VFIPPRLQSLDASIRVDIAAPNALPADLIVAWRALAADAAEPNSFMEPWFAVPALSHLAADETVRILAVWQAQQLIGVIPISTLNNYGRIRVKHTVNWHSVQSFYGAPLIRDSFETPFWSAVLDTLDAATWAPNFLRIMAIEEGGAAHRGLVAAAKLRHRPASTVHRITRALLHSTLSPDAYLDEAVRGKKRKELRRLSNRLSELGSVTHRVLKADDNVNDWMADFLALEAAGWKGSDGAALANTPESEAFFRDIMVGAHEAGTLDMLRIDLDGRAIAMLINFIRPPGSYSFKIAYDEDLARFSPGVMIEIENLRRILTDSQVKWMDSCAYENHPMINSLWMERRTLVQVSVSLNGTKRRAVYTICRLLETLSAMYRNPKLLWS